MNKVHESRRKQDEVDPKDSKQRKNTLREHETSPEGGGLSGEAKEAGKAFLLKLPSTRD